MLQLLKKLFGSEVIQPEPLKPKRILQDRDLRLDDWQKNEVLVSRAKTFMASEDFRMMLAVLRTESPANYGLQAVGTSLEDRAAWQARTEGYHACLNNIEVMGELKSNLVEFPSTYERPE